MLAVTGRSEHVGDNVAVFLPSIPGVHRTPRFHEPLRSILIFLKNLWDAQKIHLSRSMDNCHFVSSPPEAAWMPNPDIYFSSLDRIHPSELGYAHWGRRIAKKIFIVLKDKDSIGREVRTATPATAGDEPADDGVVPVSVMSSQ